ncbi:hypothetical protein [Cyanobium sp. Cruz-8H5]|uniref:hypothetical protein n=1 Tax=Cyanobium sp. Cruz-8H5 TaxID=2823712 RepID=UPI0020CD8F06|nr:hypothetical protein [Cyanobium sp. Cruz-8H5]MCP9861488.1 hypothetical protein [Cyanobium sp. Cruz-8H5]
MVLDDWHAFLGRPSLPWVVSTLGNWKDNFSEAELTSCVETATLIRGESSKLPVHAIGPAMVYQTIKSIRTPWAVLVKLDTLPYSVVRAEGWIDRLVEDVERHGYWGATGSFRPIDVRLGKCNAFVTQCFSENFSVFRPSEWLKAVESEGGDLVSRMATGQLEPGDRFGTERAVDNYMRKQGLFLRFVSDTPDRSMFHINQWGERLLALRERYLRREGVEPYLNLAVPERGGPGEIHPWDRYYGYPKPALLKRLRIWAGVHRRRLLQR